MKEKRQKSHKKDKKKRKKRERRSSSSSNSSTSEKWVEKETVPKQTSERDNWMAMTGQLKTYTKDEIRPKKEEKDKKHIDSYNPSTSSRELNPYWKNGGTGVPQTAEAFRQSRQFLKPCEEEDYYSKPGISTFSQDSQYQTQNRANERSESKQDTSNYKQETKYYESRSYNWKKSHKTVGVPAHEIEHQDVETKPTSNKTLALDDSSSYLSDEKMNKLGAKIVKAEIMGDMELADKLKTKLEAARQFRKDNPNTQSEDIMLLSTCKSGNVKPLSNTSKGDPRSFGNKRKADTHMSGERAKYFGNDDKYNLKQMFQNEKYGDNYNDEAELAKIVSKSKNPNDDLEDIFLDEISKNRNEAKDADREKQKSIRQHVQMSKTLEGCEYCVDSKNMLKHMMVSCGNNVYVALPARKSLVEDQCIITTIQHATCVTSLDEDVWEEILNYRKALTQFYNSKGKDVVFFETASRLHKYPHMVINCVPLPRDVCDSAAIYFKKALLECESEWSMNKKVVELRGKDIRKGVPKGLPYFWIDFGMDPGFAHVIEDQHLFPDTFGEEIIAGVLDIDHSHWKNTKKDFREIQRKKVMDFFKDWKPFDPTKSKI